jgi:hypothetical protein
VINKLTKCCSVTIGRPEWHLKACKISLVLLCFHSSRDSPSGISTNTEPNSLLFFRRAAALFDEEENLDSSQLFGWRSDTVFVPSSSFFQMTDKDTHSEEENVGLSTSLIDSEQR